MSRSRGGGLGAVLVVLAGATAAADVLDEITRQQPGVTKRHSSGLFDPESNADAYHLAASQRITVAELEGPGEIRHIWFTVAGQDRRWPRSLVLRVFWDGAELPSVETPIGDFFAAGNGMRANVSSLPIEVTSYGRALNSYWHMPFRKKARVELWNQSRGRMTVYCQINWLQLPALAPDTWRRVTAAARVTLADRAHELTVEMVARHPQSTGYCAGLDAILLRPED